MTSGQGLTLVHFPAQRKHLFWDKGYLGGDSGSTEGVFKGCVGVAGGIRGFLMVYFVSETAPVEVRSG